MAHFDFSIPDAAVVRASSHNVMVIEVSARVYKVCCTAGANLNWLHEILAIISGDLILDDTFFT